MKVQMLMDHSGHIHIWINESDKNSGKEADLVLSSQVDISAMISDIGPDSSRELCNGWTIVDQEIDPMWISC